MKQAEIAAAMNLSPSKVNRLIVQGRRLGMLRIEVESPFQGLVELEKRMVEAGGLGSAVVAPTVPAARTRRSSMSGAPPRTSCWKHCATAT